jgi:hypothetical protein
VRRGDAIPDFSHKSHQQRMLRCRRVPVERGPIGMAQRLPDELSPLESAYERTRRMSSFDVEIMTTKRPNWLHSSIGPEFSPVCQNFVFPGLWLLIGVISAVDTYLTVKYREQLIFLESNPIASLLLELDAGDASLLIAVKFLGSTIAMGLLAALYLQNQRIGLMVSSGLACFQLGLLFYLLAV